MYRNNYFNQSPYKMGRNFATAAADKRVNAKQAAKIAAASALAAAGTVGAAHSWPAVSSAIANGWGQLRSATTPYQWVNTASNSLQKIGSNIAEFGYDLTHGGWKNAWNNAFPPKAAQGAVTTGDLSPAPGAFEQNLPSLGETNLGVTGTFINSATGRPVGEYVSSAISPSGSGVLVPAPVDLPVPPTSTGFSRKKYARNFGRRHAAYCNFAKAITANDAQKIGLSAGAAALGAGAGVFGGRALVNNADAIGAAARQGWIGLQNAGHNIGNFITRNIINPLTHSASERAAAAEAAKATVDSIPGPGNFGPLPYNGPMAVNATTSPSFLDDMRNSLAPSPEGLGVLPADKLVGTGTMLPKPLTPADPYYLSAAKWHDSFVPGTLSQAIDNVQAAGLPVAFN